MAVYTSMAARTPPRRKHWNKTERQFFGLMQDMYAVHPEALEQLRERTAREHEAHADDDSREFLHHIEDPDAKFSSSWSVKRLLMEMEPVRSFLERMTWSLVIPPDDCGPLITSDHAGVLFNPPRGGGWLPPAFGDKDSEYTFPLNQHLLIFGRYGGESDLYQLSRDGVATFNRRAFWYASEIYFPPGDFLWLSPEGTVLDRATLAKRIAEKASRRDDTP